MCEPDYVEVKNYMGDVLKYYPTGGSSIVHPTPPAAPVDWETVFADISNEDERALAINMASGLPSFLGDKEAVVRSAIKSMRDEGWESPTEAKKSRHERDYAIQQKVSAQEEADELQEELQKEKERPVTYNRIVGGSISVPMAGNPIIVSTPAEEPNSAVWADMYKKIRGSTNIW